MEKVLLQTKGGKIRESLKMPKNQTERQTTDMTENRIKEEEKEGFQKFLSAFCLFSLSFFSFFFFFNCVFEKRTNFSPTNVFFFKGVVLCKLHAQFLYI